MIELLGHNKATYERLCEVLETNNKCALVQATGTGKSYIAGKYIEEHAQTALILVPTNAIADAWSKLLNGAEQEVDIITYQAFAKEPNNYLEYDLVVADEMHHLGSDVWGKKFVETYLQSENHKIIGLTATEIRYLDNSRDMAEEIFGNIRVDGCDLPTAINTGVLPTFKYVSALYCDESDFDEWKEKAGKIKDIKTQNELKGKLDVCIKNMVSVKQAVNENLTDDYKKIIVFLNNVESKETALEMFKDVFPTANFYDVDYSKSRAENNSQIEKFKVDANRAVLFAIDMLNEGIHVKGTDCIIMFRKTVSPQVYLQQLGRGLASGTDKTPIIFDFVGNIVSSVSLIAQERNNFIGIVNKGISDKKRKIVIKTYLKPIEKCLKEIDTLFKNSYTDDEINFIKNNYKILGLAKTAKKLGRTKESVKRKAYDMGISRKTEINNDDIPKILEMIENIGLRETAEKLNLRIDGLRYFLVSKGYIDTKPQKRYKRGQILNYVKNGYSDREIVDLTGCTWSYLSTLRKRYGIKKDKGIVESDRNKKIIQEYKEGETCVEISKEFGIHESTVSRILRNNGIEIINAADRAKIPIVSLNPNGEFFKRFDSIAEAARSINSNATEKNRAIQICQSLKGKTNKTYGYKWMYEEDYQKMIAEKE